MTYHRTFNKVTRRVPSQRRNCWPFWRTYVYPHFLWGSCFSICSLLCSVLLIIVFSPFFFPLCCMFFNLRKNRYAFDFRFCVVWLITALLEYSMDVIFVPWGVIALFQSQQNSFASSCPKHFSSWLAIQIIIFYVKGKGHPPMNFDIVTFSMKTVMTLVGEDNFVKIKGSVSLPTFGMPYDWSILEVKYLHDMART